MNHRGIESDSGGYLEEVGKNELESLRKELQSIGFGKRAIDHALKNVEEKDKFLNKSGGRS